MVPVILLHVASHAVQIHSKYTDLEQRKVELLALERQLEHQYDRAELKASNAKALIESLVDGRIAVVQAGFIATLQVLKDQAADYMEEKKTLTTAKIQTRDRAVRIQYDGRILQIDELLSDIRNQAMELYREMNRVILLIGGSMPPLGGDFQRVLLLN